jgi:hypothetical protein
MARPTLTKTLDTITVMVNDHLLPGIIDQIINTNYLTKKLLGQSKPVSGGDKIKQLLEYGDDRPQWMGEWDKVNYRVKEFATAAYFDWANLHDTITFSEKQLKVMATGKEAILDLTEVGGKNLAKTFRRGFQDMVFKGTAHTDKEPYNLYDIVDNYNGALAGIDPSDSRYAWWMARKLPLTGKTYAQLITPSDPYYLEKIIGAMYDELTSDNEQPNLIVTTKKTWRTYENLLRASNRYVGNKKVNGSFNILMFDQAEVVADSGVPAGYMYFLNTKYLGFKHHKDFDLKNGISPFEKVSTGQKAFAGELTWYGAFTCSNRAYQGVVTGIPENPITIN